MCHEIVDPAFHKSLWQNEVIVNVYDYVIVFKVLKDWKHLLHDLYVRTWNPIYLECGFRLLQFGKFLWNATAFFGELNFRKVQIDSIWLDCIGKYRLHNLNAVPYAFSPASKCHNYFSALVHGNYIYHLLALLVSKLRVLQVVENVVNAVNGRVVGVVHKEFKVP